MLRRFLKSDFFYCMIISVLTCICMYQYRHPKTVKVVETKYVDSPTSLVNEYVSVEFHEITTDGLWELVVLDMNYKHSTMDVRNYIKAPLEQQYPAEVLDYRRIRINNRLDNLE